MNTIGITSLILDPSAQARTQLSEEAITDYADAMREGAGFPPVTAFGAQEAAYLADGWHRVLAARKIGVAEIEVDLRPGGLREAILHAVGANSEHGVRRSNDDKRRSVEKLLKDPEWSTKADTWIADRCAVSSRFVGVVRSTLEMNGSIPSVTMRRRADGSLVDTKNRGWRPKPAVEEPVATRRSTLARADHVGSLPPTLACPDASVPTKPSRADAVADGAVGSSPTERGREAAKALHALRALPSISDMDPVAVAAAAADPGGELAEIDALAAWIPLLRDAMRARAESARPIAEEVSTAAPPDADTVGPWTPPRRFAWELAQHGLCVGEEPAEDVLPHQQARDILESLERRLSDHKPHTFAALAADGSLVSVDPRALIVAARATGSRAKQDSMLIEKGRLALVDFAVRALRCYERGSESQRLNQRTARIRPSPRPRTTSGP